MNLARTSLLNSSAVATRLGTALFLNKLLAVYVGPAGYAVIGQFQSLTSIVSTLASGALNSGVIKLTAQHADNPTSQRAVWRTAALLGMCGAAVGSLVILLMSKSLAVWVLGDAAYASVFGWLAASLVFVVLNGLLLAVLNGLKAIRPFVICNIAGSLISAGVASVLVLRYGLYGALVALATSQAVALIVTAWVFHRTYGSPRRALAGSFDPAAARALGAFALMAITTAIAAPSSQLVIRNQLALSMGWSGAGLWQSLNKISELHLMLLTTTLSVYLLPRLAEIRHPAELRLEIRKTMRFVLPLVTLSASLMYLTRELLITSMLTREFMPISGPLGVQLVGDVLKMGSWVLAYTMISHGRTGIYISTEIAFALLLAILTIEFARHWNLWGTAAAYALTYFIYWIVMFGTYRSLVRKLERAFVSAAPATRPRQT